MTKECKYCYEPHELIQDLLDYPQYHNLTARIEGKGIYVSFVVGGRRTGEWIDIEYCPICGRKLEEV